MPQGPVGFPWPPPTPVPSQLSQTRPNPLFYIYTYVHLHLRGVQASLLQCLLECQALTPADVDGDTLYIVDRK